MNIRGDRTPARLALGVRLGRRRREARDVRHHQERHRSSTTRRRASRRRISTGTTRRSASRRARTAARTRRSWSDVQFQRMPNVSLLPGDKDLSLGRPHRGHRSRHRDHRRRLVLDRPAALQRAVRRPGLLRDQGRQDRRHAQGRRVSDAHAGVLESHGHDRRPDELLPRRRVRRRQGTAGPGERGAHGCVPARFRNVNVINTGRTA